MGGCGCKLAPDILEQLLDGLRSRNGSSFEIGGISNNEDCSFYPIPLSNETLLSTVDFFSPIVDEAFIYGQIAAANALSDIFAKGGRPILALAVLGWPIHEIPVEVAKAAIAGLRSKCEEASVPILGGHSIVNSAPLLGMCVNGIVKNENLLKNSSAKPGDQLFLTKPLGTGVYSTALKMGLLTKEGYRELVEVTTELNLLGARIGGHIPIHAATDVTGFGLLGHLLEMCKPGELTAFLNKESIPTLNETEKLLQSGVETRGAINNRRTFGDSLSCTDDMVCRIISDPQTNGGLLFAVGEEYAKKFIDFVETSASAQAMHHIGYLEQSTGGARINVR